MKANEVYAAHYLKGTTQIWIPPYQRPYRWNLDRWTELWRDFSIQYQSAKFLTEENESIAHFMGSLIVESKPALPGTSLSQLAIIDGQQRLLTFFALLAAIRDQHAYMTKTAVDVDNRLSVVSMDYSPDVPRVKLERKDDDTLDRMLRGDFVNQIPWKSKDSLQDAYVFFRRQAWIGESSLDGVDPIEVPKISRADKVDGTNILSLWEKPKKTNVQLDPVITDVVFAKGLKLLEILLDTTDEEASIIFETMNSRRTELLQFDQLRSSIWVALPSKREKFHKDHWLAAEASLVSVKKSTSRAIEEQFFYEYLIGVGIGRTTFRSLHRDFMQSAYDSLGYPIKDETRFISEIMIPMADWAMFYPLATGQSTSAKWSGGDLKLSVELNSAIKEMNSLGGATFHPLVLQIINALATSAIKPAEALKAVQMMQSFIVRYMLSGGPLSPMRSMTMRMAEQLAEKTFSIKNLKTVLVSHGWAADAKVMRAVKQVELYSYGGSTIFPILRGVESALSKRGANSMPYGSKEDEYSIEHLFPQTSSTSKVWTDDVASWGDSLIAMQERTHVLGNLTAVTNYDNKKNARKRFKIKKGLIENCAPLKLNNSVIKQDKWDRKVIDERTILLAQQALQKWPMG